MHKIRNPQTGFAHVGLVLLIVLVLGVVGGGGYYVWQRNHEKTQSADTSQSGKKSAEITNYEECIKSEGSRIQESYPATCVTKDNQRFTQPIEQKYLVIKEWSVKLPLSKPIQSAYYVLRPSDGSKAQYVDVFDAKIDMLKNSTGVSCKDDDSPLFVITRVKSADVSTVTDSQSPDYLGPIGNFKTFDFTETHKFSGLGFHQAAPTCATLNPGANTLQYDQRVLDIYDVEKKALSEAFSKMKAE